MKAVHNSKNESKKWEKEAEPILSHLLNGQHLIPVDIRDGCVSRILNRTCGINYLLIEEGSVKVYGVSSRVQCGKNYRTFIFSQSEYEKRTEAFATGGIWPYYTMQVYMDSDSIIGLGLIKTVDLMQFIVNGLADKKRDYICSWDKLRDAGYRVMEYSVEEPKDENAGEDEDAEEFPNIVGRIIEIVKKTGPLYCTY